jgi:PKD repeat protein
MEEKMKSRTFNKALIIYILSLSSVLFGQSFTKVTGSPVSSFDYNNHYGGVAWADYNNDGHLDLLVSHDFLFRNDGSGNFTQVDSILGNNFSRGIASGVSWADYDNDGYLDCYITSMQPTLFRNKFGDGFHKVTSGDIAPDGFQGWTAAWADWDNDSYVDLVVTHPQGFLGTPYPSRFFHNNKGGSFTKMDEYEFTSELHAYTVATWSDYDLDGDSDLFIASGPVSSLAPDYLYDNPLNQSGEAGFEKITEAPLGTDDQNGQIWNFIDFDNDRDLDAYLTNYQNADNRFYVNNNGSYSEVENSLTISGSSLANNWGDMDNDGDLDVVITSESETQFFRNDDGNFTKVNTDFTADGASRGATMGDYDNDGDLDIFIAGGDAVRGLFKNELDNGNNWIIFDLEGTVSNKSAIGAKIHVKANIDGQNTWMMREISAQNSFNSHNSLRAHFGLGNASSIDSVVIEWSSGNTDVYDNLNINEIHHIEETIPENYLRSDLTAKQLVYASPPATVEFKDISVYDDALGDISWEWDFNNDGNTDATGQNPTWTYESSGKYTVSLTVTAGAKSETKTKEDYIEVKKKPGFPVINSITPDASEIQVEPGDEVDFSIDAMDTTGYEISYTWYKNGTSQGTGAAYTYKALSFLPVPRTDSVSVTISNGFNESTNKWVVHVDTVSTSVDENDRIPENYILAQNYPNPFNPATNIEFGLPEAAGVQIIIYNSLGQEILKLTNKQYEAGFHQLQFNAADLTSGMYFYKIKTAEFSQVKKMLLVK